MIADFYGNRLRRARHAKAWTRVQLARELSNAVPGPTIDSIVKSIARFEQKAIDRPTDSKYIGPLEHLLGMHTPTEETERRDPPLSRATIHELRATLVQAEREENEEAQRAVGLVRRMMERRVSVAERERLGAEVLDVLWRRRPPQRDPDPGEVQPAEDGPTFDIIGVYAESQEEHGAQPNEG